MFWNPVLPSVVAEATAWSVIDLAELGESGRLLAMIALAMLGVLLLFASSWLASMIAGRRTDPAALSRILQIAGALLLLVALVVRPHNPDTAAFPPPSDMPAQTTR